MRLSRGARRLSDESELLRLFRWCHYNNQGDRALSWFAEKMGWCLRKLKYALDRIRHLLVVRRRARQSAIWDVTPEGLARRLYETCTSSRETCTSSPSLKEDTDKTEEETPRKRAASEGFSVSESKTLLAMVGFERFFGLFLAAGKALHKGDMIRAQAMWTRLKPEDQRAAFLDAEQQLMRTSSARFVPLPENYLSARPWTRTALPRTLPYIDGKMDAELAKRLEVRRMLAQRIKERKLG